MLLSHESGPLVFTIGRFWTKSATAAAPKPRLKVNRSSLNLLISFTVQFLRNKILFTLISLICYSQRALEIFQGYCAIQGIRRN